MGESHGKLPVEPLEPIQGWLMPRTTDTGTLKSVIWHALDVEKIVCPLAFEDEDAVVTLPAPPWPGGWLQI